MLSALDPLSTSWTSGYNLWEIFQLIRDYDNNLDNGVVDGSNMWKAMYDTQQILNGIVSRCTTGDSTAKTSPFNFGADSISGQSFNCTYDGTDSNSMGTYTYSAATKHENSVWDALIGWSVVGTSSTTRIVYQVQFNETSKEIILNETYLVDYGGNSSYNVRLYVNGNAETNIFTLKLWKGPGGIGVGGGSYKDLSITGYGKAKGSGVFLLKVTTTNTQPSPLTNKYFCFQSNATQAQMEAMDDTGSASVPTDCSTYQSNVDAIINKCVR